MTEQIKDLKEYFKNVSMGRVTPKDPYALSYSLLLQDENNILIGDLAEKQALLAYLGDDLIVNLYQNDIDILTRMRNMALRDEKMLPIFTTLFYSWLGTIKITRAKEGLERQLQGKAVGSATAPAFDSGYGEQFAAEIRRKEQEADRTNPIRKLMDKFGRK
ncbi:MAG: hypothetical protein ABIM30_06010 [candidate division WOR-3 bacterium]